MDTIIPALNISYYPPDVCESTRIAANTVVRNRKAWKPARSNHKQLVWSPQLELALIAGLEKYRPNSSTNPRRLQRLPYRNCRIAEYIKKSTGHERTPKQVGSRIQQLKDHCKDKRILRLINRRDYTPEPESPDTSTSGEGSFTSSPSAASPSPQPCETRELQQLISDLDINRTSKKTPRRDSAYPQPLFQTRVNIKLSPKCILPQASPANPGQFHPKDRELSTDDASFRSCADSAPRLPIINMASDEITTHISFLPTLPPDIQFSSPILFSTSEFLSCFRVYVQAKWRYTDFAEFALESSSLHYSATDGEQHKHLYVTKLVPYYWQTLLGFEPDDLFQCSIVQEISRRDTVQKSTPENSPEIIYSVTYRFQPYITTLTQGSSVAEGEPAMVVSKRQIDDCPTVFNAPSVAEGFPLVRLADDTCPSQRLPDTLGLDPPLREYPLTIHPSQSMQFGHYDGQQQQQLYTLHPQVDVPAYFWRAHNTNCLDYQNLVPAPLISDTGVGNTGFASNCDDQYHQDPCEFVHQSSLQHQYGVGIRTAQINDHGPHEPHGRFHVPHTLPSYDNTRVHHQEWAAGAVAQPHCHCQTLENTIISL